ncbi:MAG TPA: allantoate amidohydrolase [Terracidiphilus sp.]|nr:allantoate amidohydrolase [Terracidiphilus sp.]
MTEEPGRTTRRFLTPPMRDVHAWLRNRMEELGMQVRMDAIGNMRGIWMPDNAAGSRRYVIGSHVDTVPDAGAFDGVLGVMSALEWVVQAQEIGTPFGIEVIAFSEEEGVRYATPFLGSRAVAGTFDERMLACEDADGITMGNAIREFGLDPAEIKNAKLEDGALGFIEVHIEQGPVLEAENLQLAVVEGIVGQSRMELRFTGQANHAGTTPMHLRHDALEAAAEWIVEVGKMARAEEGLVATVGKAEIRPNAGNVIPGRVDLSLDVRHMDDAKRARGTSELLNKAEEISTANAVQVTWKETLNQRAVAMNGALTQELMEALTAAGYPARRMPSGAGHDAMVMAACVPTAMLFVRSPGGVSHHPSETVREEDVEASLHVARTFLQQRSEEFRQGLR